MIIVKRVLAIIVILAIFASGVTFLNRVIPTLAEGSDDSKISGLLALQIEAKLRAVKAGGVEAALEDSLQASRIDILRTPAQVKDALESTAIDKGAAGWDEVYGWGLIDAPAAVGLTGAPPQIEWLHWFMQIMAVYHYAGGVLVGVDIFAYFENIGGPGTVDFEPRIVREYDGYIVATTTGTFDVESGQAYRLTIPIYLIGSDLPGAWHEVYVASPSASSDLYRGGGNEDYWSNAHFGEMSLEIYAAPNTPPEVTSVTASQGSSTVDITYDVSDNEQSTVDVSLEYWDGSWHPCTNTAGDVGPGINIGTGKAATWNAKAQLDAAYISGCKVRVTADDGDGGTDSEESNPFDLDTAPPTITSESPIGSDVSVNSSVTIAFSESMNASSTESAFSISPTVLGSFNWTDDTMTFDPTTNLAYSTEYAVTIQGTAVDSAGNGLDGNENGIAEGSPADDYTWSFTTEAAVVGEGCFIATAAYGTPMAEEIEILRDFRDEYLLTNPMGQAFVDFYYEVSPPIAEFITDHPSLKPIVRAGLLPAVVVSTVAVNTTPAEKMIIASLLVLVSVALAVWATRRRGRGPEYS